eukprot:COSAG05_NODE_2290_length_3269_cov_2.473186_1_plen_94_part_00
MAPMAHMRRQIVELRRKLGSSSAGHLSGTAPRHRGALSALRRPNVLPTEPCTGTRCVLLLRLFLFVSAPLFCAVLRNCSVLTTSVAGRDRNTG